MGSADELAAVKWIRNGPMQALEFTFPFYTSPIVIGGNLPTHGHRAGNTRSRRLIIASYLTPALDVLSTIAARQALVRARATVPASCLFRRIGGVVQPE